MKILAIERENPEATTQDFGLHLKNEAAMVWELQQEGVIREIYFRQDVHEAVLILECQDKNEAERILQKLPLVHHNLISFDIMPLIPYPGFSRLFEEKK